MRVAQHFCFDRINSKKKKNLVGSYGDDKYWCFYYVTNMFLIPGQNTLLLLNGHNGRHMFVFCPPNSMCTCLVKKFNSELNTNVFMFGLPCFNDSSSGATWTQCDLRWSRELFQLQRKPKNLTKSHDQSQLVYK